MLSNDRRIELEIAKLAGLEISNGGIVGGLCIVLPYASNPNHFYTVGLPYFLVDSGSLFRQIIQPSWDIEMKGISAFVSTEVANVYYQGAAHSNVRSRALALAVYALQQKLHSAGVLGIKAAETPVWDPAPGVPVRLKGTRLTGEVHAIADNGKICVEFKEADRSTIDEFAVTDLEPA